MRKSYEVGCYHFGGPEYLIPPTWDHYPGRPMTRTSSTHSNLRKFPQLEPVSPDRLRAISRELLEIADLEQVMIQRIRSLSIGLAQLQSAKRSGVAEQKALLERLARGAKLAG
jgi:hypothetical protein